MRDKVSKQEQLEQAKQAERIRGALRWTDDNDVAPDVPPPPHGAPFGTLTTGWTFNVYSRRVEVACSSSTSHAVGCTDRTNAQRPLRLYSTRQRALCALRAALEHEFATELAKIDLLLEQKDEKARHGDD